MALLRQEVICCLLSKTASWFAVYVYLKEKPLISCIRVKIIGQAEKKSLEREDLYPESSYPSRLSYHVTLNNTLTLPLINQALS